MKILRNTLPISDIYNMLKNGELTINRSYQRGTGLWPENARSYFIDTVLNEFPFPKVVMRQVVDLKTKKSRREIIDGQQRLTTIRDYIDNKFKLTSVSKQYKGNKFEDLPEEISTKLLSYEVSIDNIVTASTDEILEVFRRINSYTLPLNTSEKRHATFQGEFKWFISDLTEYATPFFEKYQTLSIREISRMADADLITECCQIKLQGIKNRSAKNLNDLYSTNDIHFEEEEEMRSVFLNTFNFIKDNLLDVFENCSVPSYIFYSLMGALIFNKYGFPDDKEDMNDFNTSNQYVSNIDNARDHLIRMFTELEDREEHGTYEDFVKASVATTHSYKNRLTRIQSILTVLQEA